MSERHLVNISGGAASAVCLFRVIERYGAESVSARLADTRSESADTYRFVADVERVSGIPITRLDQGKNCWDIWFERMMFTDPKGGGCVASYHLKKIPLRTHAEANYDPADTTIHIGFSYDEDDRRKRIIESGKPWKFDFPLCWTTKLSRCDVLDECRSRGIEPPAVYEDGYPHNNCDKKCILAGISQWSGVLKDDPKGYAEFEANEQEFMRRLSERGRTVQTFLKDRRGGDTKNYSLKQLREDIEGGRRIPNDGWRSCSCMGGLFE